MLLYCGTLYGWIMLIAVFVAFSYENDFIIIIIIIIIIIMIIIFIISCVQGIYTYIPETIYVPREYSVAVILLFLFMVHTSLAPVLNLLHFTSALSAVCVQCPVWLFSVVTSFRAFPICCSGIFWIILRWFQLPLLLLVSHLFLHSTRAVFLL
jgi:hypothetical protein